MVRPGRVALAHIQEREQVLGLDIWQVPGRTRLPRSGSNLIHKIYGQGQSDAARTYEAIEGGGMFANGNFCRAKAHAHLGPNVHRHVRKVLSITPQSHHLFLVSPFAFMIL
jgi:hypothetical protein